MHPKIILFVVLGALAGGLTALLIMNANNSFVSPSGHQSASGKALIGGPFSLVNHEESASATKTFMAKKCSSTLVLPIALTFARGAYK